MGWRLAEEVLDNLPADIDTGGRLLLVVLALMANDETRQVIPPKDEPLAQVLARRTGLKPRGIAAAAGRLASAGLDPRVSIRIDKNGNPLFAVPGRGLAYRIPTFGEGHATASPSNDEGHATASPSTPEGHATASTLDATASTLDATACPLPSTKYERQQKSAGWPQESDHPARQEQPPGRSGEPPLTDAQAEAVAVLMRKDLFLGQLDERTAQDCARQATGLAKSNLAGLVNTFSLSRVRKLAAQYEQTWRGDRAPARTAGTGSRCEHEVYNGAEILGTGANASRRCPRCEADDPAEVAAADDAAAFAMPRTRMVDVREATG